jgi:hypothetical protein
MEGFSKPGSNERRAGLSNPHPKGLQSHCFLLPVSLPLRLHQATALCKTHTWWDIQPSATPASSPQTHTMQECRNTHHLAMLLDQWPLRSPPPVNAGPQPWASPTAHQNISPLPQAHCLSDPAEPQLCVGDWTSTLRLPPPPPHQALPGSSSMWNNWSPTLLGQAPAWCETAASTSLLGTHVTPAL